MARILETIPPELAAEAEAARAWFSRSEGSDFELTGIVDPRGGSELQLILCGTRDGREVCLRERFAVRPAGAGFDVTRLEDASPALGSPAPRLDPPAGVRAGWLEQALARHAFVVLVFYRGFW